MRKKWVWKFCGYFLGVSARLGQLEGSFLEWGYFLGCKKFQIFFGVFNIPAFLGGLAVVAGPSLRLKK